MEKNIQIINKNGKSVGELEIKDKWIELQRGEQAVHDVVVAYRAALRAGTASTKTRAEVRGGGAKPWRQKGTGRARAGSSRSPIWVGGGIAFGPKPRSFKKKVNKKVMKLALKRAFSERLQESVIRIVDKIDFDTNKTKNIIAFLKDLNLDSNKKILIVVKDYSKNVLLATRNIQNVFLMKASSLDVYHLLHSDNILFSEEAIKEFVERF